MLNFRTNTRPEIWDKFNIYLHFCTEISLPEEHDEEQEVAEEPDDDEERVEEDDDDEEPGVVTEQGPEVGGAEVHRGVAVQAGQELHQGLDEGGVNSSH